jgi:hypothetical protein
MKKFFLALCLCLCQQLISAQDNPVKLSDKFQVSSGPVYPMVQSKFKYYFSLEPQFSIVLKRVGDQIYVQKFDNATMSKVSEKVYNDIGSHDIERVMESHGNIYYIYSWNDKTTKKKRLYCRTITKEGVMLPVKALCPGTDSDFSIIDYVSIEAISGAVPLRYTITESSDRSKIMARYRLTKMSRTNSKNFERFGFEVFDAATLERQWGGEVQMPYNEEDMNYLAFAVTKNGNVNLLAYVRSIQEFQLMVFHPDLSVTTHKLDMKPFEIEGFEIQETADGNLLCTGYYANGIDILIAMNKIGSIGFSKTKSFNNDGLIQIRMTQEGKILDSDQYAFPIELINQYENERRKEKNNEREAVGNAGINDLKVVEIFSLEDGSTIILGEQYNYQMSSGRVKHMYGDIIATKLDSKGQLIWMKKLPKSQVGYMFKGSMSIKITRDKGFLTLLFVDSIRNANLLKVEHATSPHIDGFGGILTAYILNESNGEIEKHNIVDFRNIKDIHGLQFKTKNLMIITPDTFMIEVVAKEERENAMLTIKMK